MLQFLFLSFGIICSIEICIFIINIFSTNFFSYGNSLGIHWVIYGFGSILGLPFGLALQTSYKIVKNQFTQCSTEVFISRLIGLALGLVLAHLFFVPFSVLLTSKELLVIQPLLAMLVNVLFAYVGILSAGLHSRYFLEFLIPKFVESLLIYESIAKPATVRMLDQTCLAKHKLIQILKTKFFEGSLIIDNNIVSYYKNLLNSSNSRQRYYGESTIHTINQLKQHYPNQIVLNTEELNISSTPSFPFIPIFSTLEQNKSYNSPNPLKRKLNLLQLIKELRPPYLYGDILSLKIQKKGNRFGQGVGYLEDGTLVVVEKGYPYIGQQINVIVKKIRQRSSGRILFTYPQITLLTSRNRRRKEKKRVILKQRKKNEL